MFHQVLHFPVLQNSLLSVLYLTRMQDFHVLIDKQSMKFERQGVLLFTASLQGKLAYLDGVVATRIHVICRDAWASAKGLGKPPRQTFTGAFIQSYVDDVSFLVTSI